MPEQTLQSVAFPILVGSAGPRIRARAREPTQVVSGRRDPHCRAGDRDFKFFVVMSGRGRDRRRLRRRAQDGRRPRAGRVRRRRVPGDRPRRRSISAVARGDCEVYEVSAGGPAGDPQPVPGPGRRHPPGVHRPPAAPPRVGGLHRPAGDRLPLLAPDTFRVRDFLAKNRVAVHLAGPGGRPGGEPTCSGSSG